MLFKKKEEDLELIGLLGTLLICFPAMSKVTLDIKENISKLYDDLKSAKEKLSTFDLDERMRLREIDILKYEIEELENANLKDGKEEKHLTQQREYHAQQSKIQLVEKQITELKKWTNKAHAESTKKDGYKEYYRMKAKKKDVQIRSKQKRIELELSKKKVERPVEEAEVKFSIDGNKKKGKRIIEAKNLIKAFNGETLFHNVSFTIQSTERVGMVMWGTVISSLFAGQLSE